MEDLLYILLEPMQLLFHPFLYLLFYMVLNYMKNHNTPISNTTLLKLKIFVCYSCEQNHLECISCDCVFDSLASFSEYYHQFYQDLSKECFKCTKEQWSEIEKNTLERENVVIDSIPMVHLFAHTTSFDVYIDEEIYKLLGLLHNV